MSVQNRIRKVHRHNLDRNLKTKESHLLHLQQTPAIHRDPEKADKAEADNADVYLMVNVQPIDRLPWWARQVIRWIYFRYGWCASIKTERGEYLSLEYRGVTPDEAEARFYSSEPNCSYTKVPWRSCLPIETGQYGTHDFPLSEVSSEYRKRELPFVQVSRERMVQLEKKVEEVYRSASA